MKWKWNWGVGIAVVYTGFVLIRLGVVIFSETQGVELVTPDYYDREIRYDERMEEIRNTESLPEKPAVKIEDRTLYIQMPSVLDFRQIQGAVIFYRPSDKRADRVFRLTPDDTGVQRIDLNEISTGYWKIQLMWQHQGNKYYQEFPVIFRY